MALLHAHKPEVAGGGNGAGDRGSVDQDRQTIWSTGDWLKVAAAIEKPVLSLNSEHGDRKDERAFTQAFRAGQLTVCARPALSILASLETH
jgi:hypothetical protein